MPAADPPDRPVDPAELGRAGERLAAELLRRRGWRVEAAGWRATGEVRGELDLVCWDGTTLVVVEVKTRRGRQAPAAWAVDTSRLARLRRLAGLLLAERRLAPEEVRVDLLALTWPAGAGAVAVEHLEGVG